MQKGAAPGRKKLKNYLEMISIKITLFKTHCKNDAEPHVAFYKPPVKSLKNKMCKI
jgi:hypothetical protein